MEIQDRIGQLSDIKRLALRKLLENKDIGDDALLSLGDSNVRMLRKGEPKLFIYPATDGSVGYMRYYLPHIPEQWGVYALQTPGLEGEQEPYRTIADIARHGIERIREVQPAGPYYIAGHCMGGLPAYETARQLSANGDEVGLVLHLYPIFNRPWKDLPTGQDELQLRAIIDYCYIIEHLLNVKIDLPVETLATLDREAQMDRVIEEFRRNNYLGSADPEIIPLGPNSSFCRVALEDVHLGGTLVRKGEMILPVFQSGNHDGSVFAEADTFRPGRNHNHLAFGWGPHRCLGAPLASLELQAALTALAASHPGLRLAEEPDRIQWKQHSLVRGPLSLPVRWDI
ncbi:cytochrome P450 [Streptomyces sp. NPDC004787]|uniref:cytochrome P450 n=1 Tax=Streptomyces sp. NPDC004787 TaxID=3154291 RepID=UPI0033A0A252